MLQCLEIPVRFNAGDSKGISECHVVFGAPVLMRLDSRGWSDSGCSESWHPRLHGNRLKASGQHLPGTPNILNSLSYNQSECQRIVSLVRIESVVQEQPQAQFYLPVCQVSCLFIYFCFQLRSLMGFEGCCFRLRPLGVGWRRKASDSSSKTPRCRTGRLEEATLKPQTSSD